MSEKKYILPLLFLLATGCVEEGKKYTKNEFKCLKSHRQSYTCMQYNPVLKRMTSRTCVKTVCDYGKCYRTEYRSNGWFRRPDKLNETEISCE